MFEKDTTRYITIADSHDSVDMDLEKQDDQTSVDARTKQPFTYTPFPTTLMSTIRYGTCRPSFQDESEDSPTVLRRRIGNVSRSLARQRK